MENKNETVKKREWQGLDLSDPEWPLEKCLDKVVKAFPKLPLMKEVERLILDYRKYAEDKDLGFNDESYYEEMLITSETVFTIRCYVGLCHFTIEYNFETDGYDTDDSLPAEIYGFTLSNQSTGEEVFVQNIHEYTDNEWELINSKIFSIID